VPVYIAKGKDDTYLFSAVLDKDQLEELRNMSIKARKRKAPTEVHENFHQRLPLRIVLN